MGEFQSGKWATIIILYFFFLFISVHYTVNAAAEAGANETIIYTAPAFYIGSEYSEDVECRDGSLPGLRVFCSETSAYNYQSCEIIPGCSYNNDSRQCNGILNLIDYGGRCSTAMSIDLCLVLGCAVDTRTGEPILYITNTTDSTFTVASSGGYNSIVDSISFVMGFKTDLGLSLEYNFIYSFFFFWIPFFMLSYCIYMMLPFAH